MEKKKLSFIEYIKFMSIKSKGYLRFIPLIFILSLIFSIISIFIALLGKVFIDNLLALDINIILKAVAISISAYLFGAFLSFGNSYLQKFITDKLKIKMQLSFYNNMQYSEFIFFSNLSSSDIYYRMFNDIGIIVDFYLNLIINLPIKIIVFVISLGIMLNWSWQLTLAIIALILIQMIIMVVFRKPIRIRAEKAIESDQTLISQINEDMLKGDLCRNLALEEYNYKKIVPFFEISRKNRLNSTKFNLLYSTAISVSSQIINVCLLLLGIFFVVRESITIGSLMGISMLVGYIYQPLNDLFNIIISYQPTKISFIRYKEFDEKLDNNNLTGKEEFVNGDIKITNLSFSYGTNNVLKNFNATINKGEIAFLEGANGTGKTTLMRLITRAFHPSIGSISISNVDIFDIDYKKFRTNVIAMSSEPIIINDSFRKNIIVDREFTDDKINDIIHTCALDEVVSKLENGLDTPLGLGNAGLSMGELQKVSLARILIRQPKILILDEPLSHIDSTSCNEILDTLRSYNVKNNATIIIIGHDDRINTIATQRICLDKVHKVSI